MGGLSTQLGAVPDPPLDIRTDVIRFPIDYVAQIYKTHVQYTALIKQQQQPGQVGNRKQVYTWTVWSVEVVSLLFSKIDFRVDHSCGSGTLQIYRSILMMRVASLSYVAGHFTARPVGCLKAQCLNAEHSFRYHSVFIQIDRFIRKSQ